MKVRKEGRGWGEPCGVLILFCCLVGGGMDVNGDVGVDVDVD